MKKIAVASFVILSLIGAPLVFAQSTVEEQQKKFQEVLAGVTWKNLAIDFYDVKDKAADGYKSMTVKSADEKNGLTFYVSKKSILSLKNTESIDLSYQPGDGDNVRLMIKFNPEGKKTLAEYTTANINQMMGVVVDGKLRLVATLRQPLNNGRVQVYGFSANEAVGILERYYQPKLDAAKKFSQQIAMKAVPK